MGSYYEYISINHNVIYVLITCSEYSLNISDGPINLHRIGIFEVFKESGHGPLITIPMIKMILAF